MISEQYLAAYCAIFSLLGLAATTVASPRVSASYSIAADSADLGGRRSTSANYASDGSTGAISGVSNNASTAEIAKSGFLAQLYDMTGLVIDSPQPGINEGAALQLIASKLLDDSTLLAVSLDSITWSITGGPLVSIGANGLVTAGIVYADSPASVWGSYQGYTSSLSLTVFNVNEDDFGSYGADGVEDAWQVQYFGQPPNANAGPNVDFDGTGQTNLFKYIAGLNPLDPNSRFVLTIARVPDPAHPGQSLSSQKNLVFNPVVTGRTYTVQFRTNLLSGSWTSLSNPPTSDSGNQRTVTDQNATGSARFYRVQITKP